MRFLIFLLGMVFCLPVFAQNDSIPPPQEKDTLVIPQIEPVVPEIEIENDTLVQPQPTVFQKPPSKNDSVPEITIKDYKIITYARDTMYLDTSLTIQKEYKYNYLRRDDFELMPFSNIGRPYNQLGRDFSTNSFYPRMGASARNIGYMEVEDILYFNVATPVSDLMFKTTLEQGQLLDALLTFNMSPQLNLSVAFKGFRSLGQYRFDQTQSGNFRTSLSYNGPNGRYNLRAHIAAQDLESEENGGISDRTQFEEGEEDFDDRFRLDVLYTDANTRILGKRYYFDQTYKVLRSKKDSTERKAKSLYLGHEFNYETKFFQFTQTSAQTAFGSDPFTVPIADRARLKTMFNRVSLGFEGKALGNLSGNISHYNYNYFFNSIIITDAGTIQNQLTGDEIAVGGKYTNNFGRLRLSGDVTYNITGELGGSQINALAQYDINEGNTLVSGLNISSRLPDFNFLLFQSDYQNFNWQNDSTFEKIQSSTISLGWLSKKYGNLNVEYSALDNYTYFQSTITDEQLQTGEFATAYVRPFQTAATVNHLRVKYFKEIRWRKWALANTILYQNVTQDEQVLNVPELVTRNTLYFSSDVFKKAMYIQTGVNFKYFTSYNMDAYHPLLGEFYIQNREEFGGFPMLDVFINAKVRQTRIYLKAEHLNSLFTTEPSFYAAPEYPYRDFVIRFGLVWNFFS
ncbi:MAG: putative porin [Bacteroidota bacterium]